MFIRPKRQTQEINFDIPKNTTHLMMWLCGRMPTKKRVFLRHDYFVEDILLSIPSLFLIITFL